MNDGGFGSLREAVTTASAGDTIVFGVSGTIVLASPITISTDVTIFGPGYSDVSIDAGGGGAFALSGTANVLILGLYVDNSSKAFSVSAGQTLLLAWCVIDGNTGSSGCALDNNGGTVGLSHCTFSSNISSGSGGAIYNGSGGFIDMFNCTFSGNQSTGGSGGAVFNTGATAILQITNCTFYQNAAALMGGGIFNDNAGSVVAMGNTIIGANAAGTGADYFGNLTTSGNNLIADANGISGPTWPGPGDQGNTAHGFDTGRGLSDNGHWTMTVPLLPSSTAIDAGNNILIPVGEDIDQREAPRILDGSGTGGLIVDIGAYEYSPWCVTNTSGSVVAGSFLDVVLATQATVSFAPPYYICFQINTVIPISLVTTATIAQQPVIIDGYSQSGSRKRTYLNSAQLPIEIDGGLISGGSNIYFGAGGSGSVMKGMTINNATSHGVEINSANDIDINGCHIGTDPSGMSTVTNDLNGIFIINGGGHYIGGFDDEEVNVISGNSAHGILVQSSRDNEFYKNIIGLGADGMTQITNGFVIGGDGIQLTSSSIHNQIGGTSLLTGNIISGNAVNGITISDSDSNKVFNNIIGLDFIYSTSPVGNGGDGVIISNGALANQIGGDFGVEGNLISGNGTNGVLLSMAGANNFISGNVIGTNEDGSQNRGNQGDGVHIQNNTAAGNIVGGPGTMGNLISGNGGAGVYLNNDSQLVLGNIIGTEGTGSAPLGNNAGVVVLGNSNAIGSSTVNEGNLISGNNNSGVDISGCCNIVEGNMIGLNGLGTAQVGNGGDGVKVTGNANSIGTPAVGGGNVISGNGADGVAISTPAADNNSVQNNLIGVDLLANMGVGNLFAGVYVHSGATNTLIGGNAVNEKNTLSGNGFYGIELATTSTDATTILGNHIGLGPAGAVTIPNGSSGIKVSDARNTRIGDLSNGGRNVISGNWGDGIELDNVELGTEIYNNYIGLGAAGQVSRPNDGHGIFIYGPNTYAITIGDGTASGRNYICNNTGDGIHITGDSVKIAGNMIGVNLLNLAGGNDHGITIDGSYNEVGSQGGVNANIIANNGSNGIRVANNTSAVKNPIFSNSFYSNGLLSIDLNDDGVDTNDNLDTDNGGNRTQNYPILNPPTICGNTLMITGFLNSEPNKTYLLQFYLVDASNIDPTGHGEGTTYLSQLAVVTDASGNANFSYPIAGTFSNTDRLTATATELFNGDYLGTSEFAENTQLVDEINNLGFLPSAPSCPGATDGSIDITNVFGGVPGYDYQWGAGTGNQNGPTATNLAAGAYQITVTDTNGCAFGPITITLTDPLGMTESTISTNEICDGACDGTATIVVTNGTPPYQYAETGMGNWQSTGVFTGLCPGTYSFDVQDANGCVIQTTSVTINGGVIENSNLSYADTDFCGQSGSVGPITTGTPGGNFFVVPAVGMIIDNGTGVINLDASQPGGYQVLYVTPICSDTSTWDINIGSIPPTPTVADAFVQFCQGDVSAIISATANGGGTLEWFDNIGTSVATGSTYDVSGLGPGNYWFYVAEDNGACFSEPDSVNVTILTAPAAPVPAQPVYEFCLGDSLGAISANSTSGSITWYADSMLTNQVGNGSTFDLPPGLTGLNSFWATASNGVCTSSGALIQVIVYDGSFINAGSPQTICPGDSAHLLASGGGTYFWLNPDITNPGDPSQFVSPLVNTTYYVTVVNPFGCAFTDSVTVTVDDSPTCDFYIYNAFSPDGDGINDFWNIKGAENSINTSAQLFNRWGDQFLTIDNYDNALNVWDGTNADGTKMPAGTYFYVVKMTLDDGDRVTTGWVQLTY